MKRMGIGTNRVQLMESGVCPLRFLLLLLVATVVHAQPKKPDLEAVARQVIEGTNELRRAQRLPPLEHEPRLARAAEKFARFMAATEKYGHEADGRTPMQRARAEGYRECMVAENIAYQMRTRGFETRELSEGLVAGWHASPGHRRNMLDGDALETGVGVAYSDETSRYYAVQLFGRPDSMRFSFTVRNESRAAVAYRVGDKAWEAPPRAERRHTVCRELPVVFERRGSEQTFHPGADDLIVVGAGGHLDSVKAR